MLVSVSYELSLMLHMKYVAHEICCAWAAEWSSGRVSARDWEVVGFIWKRKTLKRETKTLTNGSVTLIVLNADCVWLKRFQCTTTTKSSWTDEASKLQLDVKQWKPQLWLLAATWCGRSDWAASAKQLQSVPPRYCLIKKKWCNVEISMDMVV